MGENEDLTSDSEFERSLNLLKEKYKLHVRSEIEHIERLRTEGALDLIRDIAHNLHGNGKSYGFEPLSRWGKEIEEAIGRNDPAWEESFEEMKRWVLQGGMKL